MLNSQKYKNFSDLTSCLPNDRTQHLVIRVHTKTDAHTLDPRSKSSLSSFSEMVAENVLTFCRDLYQNQLRSFSISYVFTRYHAQTLDSLKKRCLNLLGHIVLNLLHDTTWKTDGEETYTEDIVFNDSTNKLFTIDELKLGFFFQQSCKDHGMIRKVMLKN